MAHDDIPEDREVSYECACGGSITWREWLWECDSCDYKQAGDQP